MWVSQPIFVSSTFLDFQHERDHLRAEVFPALEERLRSIRRHLEWVDLRIGVTGADEKSAEVRERQVLKVCLAEIRRCRPFLLVMLGDRYGWVPPIKQIAAAAAEEGMRGDFEGRSVTDLEIEFGALTNLGAPPRALIYFRRSLPYGRMGAEAKAYRDDGAAAARLATLKRRIEATMPERVSIYGAEWDSHSKRVVSLNQWGESVLESLWSELSRDAPARPKLVSVTQAARDALDEFVEQSARDFVGRDDLLQWLQAFVRGASAPQAVCVTGGPGTGKSALFGELTRRLRGSTEIVLSHAPAAGSGATSVDTMLRRWIVELAAALGEPPPPLEASAAPDDVEKAFGAMLRRGSARKRVVLAVDALNQFEDTPRGRYATWLPSDWFVNARLVVTALPHEQTDAFIQRWGAQRIALDAFNEREAREVARAITKRYHRMLEPKVLNALFVKPASGEQAWGNALWLTLAVEELNLVDADDMRRARSFFGGGADQLLTMMLEKVSAMPSGVADLYAMTFEQADKLYGRGQTTAFLTLLALGRAGWRESDLRTLMPKLSSTPWDELRFASLRRSFRGQLQRTGADDQWRLGHDQMRLAALRRWQADHGPTAPAHRLLASYLRELPIDDPLRQTETMVHLIAAGEWSETIAHFGGRELVAEEVEGAVLALVEAMIGSPAGEALAEKLLEAPAQGATSALAAQRMQDHVVPRLRGRVNNAAMVRTIEALRHAYERLSHESAQDPAFAVGVSFCFKELARSSLTGGDTRAARAYFDQALAQAKRAAALAPSDRDVLLHLAKCYADMGAGYRVLGERHASQEARETALLILERLRQKDPADEEAARLTGVTLSFLADLARESGRSGRAVEYARQALTVLGAGRSAPDDTYRRDLATVHFRLGLALEDAGDLTGARDAHGRALTLMGALSATDPGDPEARHDVAIAYNAVGRTALAAGNVGAAEQSFRAALDISQGLVLRDASNADWAEGLAIAQSALAKLLRQRGERDEALALELVAAEAFERISSGDPGNLARLLQACSSLSRVGDMHVEIGKHAEAVPLFKRAAARAETAHERYPDDPLIIERLINARLAAGEALMKLGDIPEAEALARDGHDLAKRLAHSAPDNPDFQRLLSLAMDKLAHVVRARGDTKGADRMFEEATAKTGALSDADPENADHRIDAAISQLQRARGARGEGDAARADSACAQALAILERIPAQRRAQPDVVRLMAEAYRMSAELCGLRRDFGGARLRLDEALRMGEYLYRTFPQDSILGRDLAVQYLTLGDLERDLGDIDAAEAGFGAALRVATGVARAAPDKAGRREAMIAHQKLGIMREKRRDWAGAEAHYVEARTVAAAIAADGPQDALAALSHAMMQCALFELYDATGQRREAALTGRETARLFRHAIALGAHPPSGMAAMLARLERGK